jgi:hypothetical protein
VVEGRGSREMKRCPQCGYRLEQARHTSRRKPASYVRKGHEYLVGVLAHVQRRIKIFKNAGGDAHLFDTDQPELVEEIRPAICQGCVEPHLIGWNEGEWHHNVKSHGGKRCDCAGCGLFVCKPWHVRFHNRVVGAGK